MHLSPDETIFWQRGWLKLNLTIATTWGVMLVMVVGSWLVTRKLSSGVKIPRWQNLLEILVTAVKTQMDAVGLAGPEKFLSFLGTLFLFIAVANLAIILPGYEPPTGSLSTTAALAICVFVAVPVFGILEQGMIGYLKTYTEPTILMLPFNLIGELTRTLALAVRLFGNIMSGTMMLAILLAIAPLVVPIFVIGLGLLTGIVQAYIFSVLATVFIAAATRLHPRQT